MMQELALLLLDSAARKNLVDAALSGRPHSFEAQEYLFSRGLLKLPKPRKWLYEWKQGAAPDKPWDAP